jgi:hypothetical protein
MMFQQGARGIQLAALTALVIASDPASVMAENGRINARLEAEYLYSDIENKDENTGEKTDSDLSRLKQKYDIELQKELFPFLEFRTGGLFEWITVSTTTEQLDPTLPEKQSSDERTSRLFAELNLNNPLYTASTSYRRRFFEFDPRFFEKTEIDREEFIGLFRWQPVGFPTFDLDIGKIRIWDEADTVDRDDDRIFFKTRYAYKDVSTDYTYTRNDSKEKIEDTGSLTQIHNGGARYTSDFFDKRVELSAAARLNYQILEPHGGGVIDRPTSPGGAQFFSADDPGTFAPLGTYTPVGPGDPLTTINIGRNGEDHEVSVGLAFGLPTELNKVYILPLVDPNDATPAEIASMPNGYVWRVFWSDDQENWTELAVVGDRYTVIDNRFEITFARVDGARFIKVVTTPQTDAPGEIRTSEIRAFTTLAVSPGMKIEDLDQNFNLGLRWLVSEKTEASYEGSFRYRDAKAFDTTRETLTNSVSVTHDFRPNIFGTARVLRTDDKATGRNDLVHHSYSTSLRVDYFETLNQTLIYSGFHDDAGDGTTYSNSIFLRTNADLYEGWNSNADLGFTARRPIEGGDLTSSALRISTDIDPNSKLNFVLDYRFSWNTQTGESSWIDQNARFQGFWVPVQTLTLFAAVGLRDRGREDDGLQVAQDYSVNWSPFPDGLLRFSLSYNRNVDLRNNTTSALSPQIDWEVTRNTLLTLRFNLGTVETDAETRDVKNVRLTLRTFY